MVTILILFIMAISALRIVVINLQVPLKHPLAQQGVLDLRGWTMPKDRTITLDGEWEFYPYQLLKPAVDAEEDAGASSKIAFIPVPGAWDAYFSDKQIFRYGTYRLRILLNEDDEATYSLRTNEIRNASAIYVNGQLAGGAGIPSEKRESYTAQRIPYTVLIPEGSSLVDIRITVSNHAGDGGVTKSIRFGTREAIEERTILSMGLQLLLSIVLLVHALYALILYVFGAGNRGLNYFALTILCGLFSVIAVDERLLFILLPLSFEITVKISLLAYIGVMAFLPPLFKQMFPDYGSVRAVRGFAVFCSVYAAFVLCFPSEYTLPVLPLLAAVLVVSVVISGSILFAAMKGQEDAIFLLLSCVSLGTNVAWTLLGPRIIPFELMHYPFDLIFTVLAFAAFWFKRFLRSVTQTKELAEKLQQTNQAKDEFLANTSHELRNPLHAVLNIAQTMLDDQTYPVHEAHRTKLGIQLDVARRMSLMVEDLLDMARLKEHRVQLQIDTVKVQAVAAGSVEMIRYLLEGKAVALHMGIPGDFPAVWADEHRLTQIMFNLLHNAVKFTERGSIDIQAEVKDGMARVHVRDTGVGMEEETLRRAFLPYEQGPADTHAAYGGFGLGLSICKQLVELQGGQLLAVSSPGEGSVFTFTLPLAEGQKQEDAGPVPLVHDLEAAVALAERARNDFAAGGEDSAPLLQRQRILAVDDDRVNLQVLTDILESASYEVSTAISGVEALAKLSGTRFDLLILDAMMPNMSGYELTRIVRERYTSSELPILLLTARSSPEDIQTGFQLGANDYLTKPVGSLELKSRVRAWTELTLSIEQRLQIEAAWLQAQIKPHFLFNVLHAISTLGYTDTDRMQILLEHFSNYLRSSFDFQNVDSVVSIEQELELVRSYLYIERERFGERLQVEWRVDAKRDVLVPPLSIQTLVENAVRHGLVTRIRGGVITIRIDEQDTFTEVAICDDGVGMEESQWWPLLHASPGNGQGIGLRNTDRRLKQLFGSGLRIQSVPDQGTTVSFRIPK
ncbi:response regulator [Paenibacillus athensensis]|uniref:histidine kinase n=1 Tax=Paenibacillus athensensis TaxID=1967502 RepID=A0A4Y8Q0F5_9BACL|nr:ATP-binding protein [Paenibacillus athensensis]MCD1258549.1 response regulator [Paenibacillus athensensis]